MTSKLAVLTFLFLFPYFKKTHADDSFNVGKGDVQSREPAADGSDWGKERRRSTAQRRLGVVGDSGKKVPSVPPPKKAGSGVRFTDDTDMPKFPPKEKKTGLVSAPKSGVERPKKSGVSSRKHSLEQNAPRRVLSDSQGIDQIEKDKAEARLAADMAEASRRKSVNSNKPALASRPKIPSKKADLDCSESRPFGDFLDTYTYGAIPVFSRAGFTVDSCLASSIQQAESLAIREEEEGGALSDEEYGGSCFEKALKLHMTGEQKNIPNEEYHLVRARTLPDGVAYNDDTKSCDHEVDYAYFSSDPECDDPLSEIQANDFGRDPEFKDSSGRPLEGLPLNDELNMPSTLDVMKAKFRQLVHTNSRTAHEGMALWVSKHKLPENCFVHGRGWVSDKHISRGFSPKKTKDCDTSSPSIPKSGGDRTTELGESLRDIEDAAKANDVFNKNKQFVVNLDYKNGLCDKATTKNPNIGISMGRQKVVAVRPAKIVRKSDNKEHYVCQVAVDGCGKSNLDVANLESLASLMKASKMGYSRCSKVLTEFERTCTPYGPLSEDLKLRKVKEFSKQAVQGITDPSLKSIASEALQCVAARETGGKLSPTVLNYTYCKHVEKEDSGFGYFQILASTFEGVCRNTKSLYCSQEVEDHTHRKDEWRAGAVKLLEAENTKGVYQKFYGLGEKENFNRQFDIATGLLLEGREDLIEYLNENNLNTAVNLRTQKQYLAKVLYPINHDPKYTDGIYNCLQCNIAGTGDLNCLRTAMGRQTKIY